VEPPQEFPGCELSLCLVPLRFLRSMGALMPAQFAASLTRSQRSLSVVYATFNVERSLDARGRFDHLSGDAFCAAFQTSSLERRDSLKTTGCGQLSRVVKYAVLGRIHVLRSPDNRGI